MKIYRVMNSFPGEENGRHEYDIHVKKTDKGIKYSLIRSQAGHWSDSVKGETVVAILDDGNDITLSKHITKQLGYDTAAELFILMSFINKQGLVNCFFMGTIEEVKNVIEI
jgi:hypothetical protein